VAVTNCIKATAILGVSGPLVAHLATNHEGTTERQTTKKEQTEAARPEFEAISREVEPQNQASKGSGTCLHLFRLVQAKYQGVFEKWQKHNRSEEKRANQKEEPVFRNVHKFVDRLCFGLWLRAPTSR
jgi:hypothetical protein